MNTPGEAAFNHVHRDSINKPPTPHGYRLTPWKERSHEERQSWEALAQAVLTWNESKPSRLLELGVLIGQARVTKNYTLAEMQAKSGIAVAYLFDIENGRVKPSPFHLHKLAIILDVNYIYLCQLVGIIPLYRGSVAENPA